MRTLPATCGSCGAAIYWLKHEKSGRPAPIEVTWNENGNIAMDLMAGTYRIAPNWDRDPDAHYHLNHFATCPQAKTWHKAGRHA